MQFPVERFHIFGGESCVVLLLLLLLITLVEVVWQKYVLKSVISC